MQALTEREIALTKLAVALGAEQSGGELSPDERELVDAAAKSGAGPDRRAVSQARRAIRLGADPLGKQLCEVRTVRQRRHDGMFFTERAIVDSMMGWVSKEQPAEIIDCGAGSGRFALVAAHLRGVQSVMAVELDPLACLVIRANASVQGATSIVVRNEDFTSMRLPASNARRAFVGNPPYVRHHELSRSQKERGRELARSVHVPFSGLSGLHTHFIMAAAVLAHSGDVLCFITSAEWLDVNYGQGLRDLFLDGLRAERIHLLDSSTAAFADAATSALIVCARSGGSVEAVTFEAASDLHSLLRLESAGRNVMHGTLAAMRTWSKLARSQPYASISQDSSDERVPIGSFARIHRGTVTGANEYFVLTREKAKELGIDRYCRPVVSAAEEVFESGGILHDNPRRHVLFCPADNVRPERVPAIGRYLEGGKAMGIPNRYVPSHRATWWRPQVRSAPPVVGTYMARQAPFFALNPDGLLILNIAHGLYPSAPLTEEQLSELVESLNAARESYRGSGRTYHGGLEKFEPKEMERLEVRFPPNRVAMLCDG